MSQKALEPTRATALKLQLRKLATEVGIDLGKPENRYSLWSENGPQGYLCWGRSPYPYEVYRLMGHYMFDGAAVLEANENGDQVVLFSCEVG